MTKHFSIHRDSLPQLHYSFLHLGPTVCRGGVEYRKKLDELLDYLSKIDLTKMPTDTRILCAEQWFLIYLESPEYADHTWIDRSQTDMNTEHLAPCQGTNATSMPADNIVLELLCWLCTGKIHPLNIQISDFMEFFLVWYPENIHFSRQTLLDDIWALRSFFDFMNRRGAANAIQCRRFMNERSKARLFALNIVHEDRASQNALNMAS